MNLPESEKSRVRELYIESLRGGIDKSLFDLGLYSKVAEVSRDILIPPEREVSGMLTIESIGEPRQGKTTLLNWISKRELGGKKIFIAGEFEYASDTYGEIKNTLSPEKFREEAFWWALMDFENFYEGKKRAEEKSSDIYWVERGGNDAMAMIQAILATDPLKFIDEKLQDSNITLEEMSELIEGLLDITTIPHAVILFLGDEDDAMERRKKDGLGTEGRLINPEIWKYLDAGYIWWLTYYYPFLKDNFGTGLMVVNGRNDSAANNEKIEEFVLEIS